MAAKRDAARAPAECVALYDAMVATLPGVERKGAGLPYTAVNGNMFSVLNADGTVALRLPEPQRGTFLKKYNATLSVQYGVVRPEYVVVPMALLRDTRKLAEHFDLSYRYTASLKPKATTRKKSDGGKQSPTTSARTKGRSS